MSRSFGRLIAISLLTSLSLRLALGQPERQTAPPSPAPLQESKTPRRIAQEASPSVVILFLQDSHGQPTFLGSGFVLRDGLVVTNWHVIEGAASGYGRIVGGSTKYSLTGAVAVDYAHDLAIVAVDGLKAPALPIGDSSGVAVGDDVYAIGNPKGLEGTFSQGIVSAVRDQEGRTFLQITSPISPGSSGGPVLNNRGQVIGIAVAIVTGGQNLNLAVPSSYLVSLAANLPTDVVPLSRSRATLLRADKLTKKMTARVSEEAEAFQRLAPEVLGEETLHQRSMKPVSHFHPRVGSAATTPLQPQYQERTIISEYGFTSFSGDLHEIRQVTTVDGKKIEDAKRAQAALAKAITANDDARKKALLKQFEKYGLLGAVTDYGQALLLFTRRNMERYEFTTKGENLLNGQKVRVFGYRQIDGPEALTLIEEKKNDQVKHLRIEGELWVHTDTFVPVRIVMVASQGVDEDRVKEEASIDYAMSAYGALLPLKTEHRETRGGKIAAENQFSYANFKKFGASSDITFESGK